jgi:hypothetical protein
MMRPKAVIELAIDMCLISRRRALDFVRLCSGFLQKLLSRQGLAPGPNCLRVGRASDNRHLQRVVLIENSNSGALLASIDGFPLIRRLPVSQESCAPNEAPERAFGAGARRAGPVNLVPTRNKAGWNAMSRGIKS